MDNTLDIRLAERAPFAGGAAFGLVGAYERLVGRAHLAVDPKGRAERGIVDLERASRNRQGLVELATDLFILKPVDLAKGNRRIFFDYGNRGNKRALQFFNDAPGSNDPASPGDAGNGFLMRRGYAIVWAAWQGDLWPGDGRMVMDVPVARDGERPLTGPVRAEFIADQAGVCSFPLSGVASTRSHPTVSLDTSQATLSRRQYAWDEPSPVPPDRWRFARLERGGGLDGAGTESAVIPSDSHIYLPGGFEPGWIYELVYAGKDPLVLGLGHLVVRDLIAFLKHGDRDTAGNANPLAESGARMAKAYCWGRSQTGRGIRDFIYRGFNEDAAGRPVFDGAFPHVSGGGRMRLNHRFSQPVTHPSEQHEGHLNYADRFPFSYARSTDHLTGETDAILKRPKTDPLVVHTQTGTEYWQRRGSLVHTDTQGNDLEQPDTARVYLWASSQHFADPLLEKPSRGVCQNWSNIVHTSMLFRALLDALDRWATDGVAPPASRIPTRAAKTLATMEEWRTQFPRIPGVGIPREPNRLPLLDYGAEADAGIFTIEPPRDAAPGREYAVLVPAVDADGNDIAGIRVPMVEAPLATYVGWNLRARGFSQGAMHTYVGSTLPLPRTRTETATTGDPRQSLERRYGDREGYAKAVEAAARRLVGDGFMLEEDVPRAVATAISWWHRLAELRG
ncbi:MAG: hypothetical protein HYR63_04870 [Proteobacteria bacterium]|nr:hypothetical protein [Pseudomonadota bacterium]MBI3496630.1 hypothetical protein [Pseudomonadota bacterium]